HRRALRAAHSVQPMLGHSDHDRRQLGHLTPRRLGDIDALAFGERAGARSAAVRPLLNDPVDLRGRKQPPVPSLVPVLHAPLPTRPLAARTTRSRRGILRRRKRRVPRTPAQTTLELSNPSLEPPVRLDQTLVRIHQLLKPQQQPNRCLTIAIEDRLGLGPLHAKPFATRTRVPAPPERLQELADFLRFCRSERPLAPMTCSAYERGVSACLRCASRSRCMRSS